MPPASEGQQFPARILPLLKPPLTCEGTHAGDNELPCWLGGTDCPCNAGITGDTGLIPGWRRSAGERNGNPL